MMPWISLDLRIPLSVNHIYIHTRHNTRLTPEAESYRDAVGWDVLAQTTPEQRESLPERLTMSMVYYAMDDLDADNGLKLLVDSVFAALGRNDRDIWHLQVDRSEHVPPGRVGVQIGGS